jgi:predicted nucleotidyltransferase
LLFSRLFHGGDHEIIQKRYYKNKFQDTIIRLYICIMLYIENQKEAINNLCKLHNVETLYIFGSALTDRFSAASDIDFLVKFKPFDLSLYFDNYLLLKEKLKDLFHREIDLLEEQTLKNPILIKSINKNKELIYG